MPIRAFTKAKNKSTANNIVPIDPSKFASLNQVEHAALYNTSPRTIGRRLKEGWKPGTPLPVNRHTRRHSFSSQSAKIIESNQHVPTHVADPARIAPTNAGPSADRAELAEFRADRFDIWSALAVSVAIGLAGVAAYGPRERRSGPIGGPPYMGELANDHARAEVSRRYRSQKGRTRADWRTP
jgi:hypothetical protein